MTIIHTATALVVLSTRRPALLRALELEIRCGPAFDPSRVGGGPASRELAGAAPAGSPPARPEPGAPTAGAGPTDARNSAGLLVHEETSSAAGVGARDPLRPRLRSIPRGGRSRLPRARRSSSSGLSARSARAWRLHRWSRTDRRPQQSWASCLREECGTACRCPEAVPAVFGVPHIHRWGGSTKHA